MAVDLTQVAQLDVEPGELPATMAAWVIRAGARGRADRRLPARGDGGTRARRLRGDRARDGGRRELQQRVGGARQAGLGLPLPPRRGPPHRRLGRLRASSGRSARASRAGSPATRSSSTATRPPTRTPRSTGSTRSPRPSQQIWGYETTWGSFAQFCKVQAQQLLPKPANLAWEEAASYGLTYFTAYRMLIDQVQLQAGHRVLIWGAAGGLGVFATQLCAAAGAECVGVVSSAEKGELVKQLGARDYIDRNEFAGMMRRGDETPEEEKARFKESRRFGKARRGAARRGARHRLRARRQGDVPHVGARRQAVRQGRDLRRDLRLPRSTSTSATCGCARSRSSARTSPTPGSATGERADRAGQGPSRALEDDGLRPGRGGPPAHAREQAPRQDRDPRRRRPRRARARPRTARARSGRRWGPDGRRRPHPLVRDGLPGRRARRRRWRRSRRSRCATARPTTRLPLPRRPLQVPADRDVRGARPTGRLLVRARSSSTSARTTRAGTRCPCSTAGPSS